MIRFSVPGIQAEIPEGWHEIDVRRFVAFLQWERDHKPDSLKKWEAAATDEAREEVLAGLKETENLNWPLYWADEVEWWAWNSSADEPLPAGIMRKAEVEDVIHLRMTMQESLNAYQPKERGSFSLAGKTFHLPASLFKGHSVIEFVEAAQMEHWAEEMKKNRWEVMPKILSILCRLPGEEYTGDLVEKREQIFWDCPMDIVLDVGFFLTKQKLTYDKVSLMLLVARAKAEASKAN